MSRTAMKSLLTLLLFTGIGLLVDTFALALPKLANPSRFPPQYHEWLSVATQVPWQAVLFGLLFPMAVMLTSRSRRTIGFEEIGAFALLCPMLAICLQYGGVFLAVVLGRVGIPPQYVLPGLFALLLGAVAHNGLFIEIGLAGCLTLFLAMGSLFVLPHYAIIPATIQSYPYTVIAFIIILFSLKERPAV